MESGFKKLIELVQHWGERCVIVNERGEPVSVLLSVSDFERLLGNRESIQELSEQELLEKINRDIALWRSAQEEERDFPDDVDDIEERVRVHEAPESEAKRDIPESFDAEDTYYFEPID